MTEDLPKAKQTNLGLYVTAKQAYTKWQADPDRVKILDVRTPEEYMFIGHPEMAFSIPIAFQSYKWDEKKGSFPLKDNPDFVGLVQDWAAPDDIILALCRSGIRSASAADLLAKVGYSNVYNITDGMEGDMIVDEDSPLHGKRLINGWKNSDSPWTYQTDMNNTRFPLES